MTTIRYSLTQDRPDWQERAKCRGMDSAIFFPAKGESSAKAKSVCRNCPVKAECLEFALGSPRETNGVWGGQSINDRRGIIRELNSQKIHAL